MAYELSEGALLTIMRGGQVDSPIMQILGSKKISGAGDNERYRLLVSDGLHVNSFAMLATQLNDMIRNGDLSDNSIVRINRFITSMVPNSGRGEKRVMIILEVELLSPGSEVGHRIGSPTPLTADGQVPRPAEVPAPAPAPVPAAAPAPAPAPARAPTSASAPAASTSRNAGFGGNYGGNIRSPAANRSMGGMGGMELNPNSQHTHPIVSLTPYQNKWVIKARVVGKSSIRTWSNSKGEGKLFSFDLVDESGEIKVTAFREQCDKYYDMIEVNKVYLLSRAQLKTANKKFSNLNNDYEITLSGESQIIPVYEDSGVPQIRFNFTPLKSIEDLEKDAIVDVMGVVKSCGDPMTIVSKTTNKEFRKRDVTIVDQSGASVSLTLWGQQADEFDGSGQPVVAVKGGKINEFNGGKSVSLMSSATFQVNPDIPEAHQLRGWFDHEGSTVDFKSLSATTGSGRMDDKFVTLKEAEVQGIGRGDKAEFFCCKATVLMCKSENAIYKACAGENCNKKVVDLNNGMYRCEKCNAEFNSFNPRLLLSISVGDWSHQSWVTVFQEQAEAILGHSAIEMQEFLDNGSDQYQQVFQQASFKSFNFRIRAQLQIYNDENRMRMTVASVKPVDHVAYSKQLLTELKELTGMGSVNH